MRAPPLARGRRSAVRRAHIPAHGKKILPLGRANPLVRVGRPASHWRPGAAVPAEAAPALPAVLLASGRRAAEIGEVIAGPVRFELV